MSDDFEVGMMMGDSREDIINQLKKEGMVVPEQDWGDDFQAKREIIIENWFKKNPECKRGTGQFEKMFPEAIAALDNLTTLTEKKRITVEEYLIICKGVLP